MTRHTLPGGRGHIYSQNSPGSTVVTGLPGLLSESTIVTQRVLIALGRAALEELPICLACLLPPPVRYDRFPILLSPALALLVLKPSRSRALGGIGASPCRPLPAAIGHLPVVSRAAF